MSFSEEDGELKDVAADTANQEASMSLKQLLLAKRRRIDGREYGQPPPPKPPPERLATPWSADRPLPPPRQPSAAFLAKPRLFGVLALKKGDAKPKAEPEPCADEAPEASQSEIDRTVGSKAGGKASWPPRAREGPYPRPKDSGQF